MPSEVPVPTKMISPSRSPQVGDDEPSSTAVSSLCSMACAPRSLLCFYLQSTLLLPPTPLLLKVSPRSSFGCLCTQALLVLTWPGGGKKSSPLQVHRFSLALLLSGVSAFGGAGKSPPPSGLPRFCPKEH